MLLVVAKDLEHNGLALDVLYEGLGHLHCNLVGEEEGGKAWPRGQDSPTGQCSISMGNCRGSHPPSMIGTMVFAKPCKFSLCFQGKSQARPSGQPGPLRGADGTTQRPGSVAAAVPVEDLLLSLKFLC